jgi:hypothetical protein
VSHVPLAGHLGREQAELHPLFFDHVSRVPLSSVTTAARRGDRSVE